MSIVHFVGLPVTDETDGAVLSILLIFWVYVFIFPTASLTEIYTVVFKSKLFDVVVPQQYSLAEVLNEYADEFKPEPPLLSFAFETDKTTLPFVQEVVLTFIVAVGAVVSFV